MPWLRIFDSVNDFKAFCKTSKNNGAEENLYQLVSIIIFCRRKSPDYCFILHSGASSTLLLLQIRKLFLHRKVSLLLPEVFLPSY